MTTPKLRPRLTEHALMRRHVIDGVEKVVVHHAATGALVALDERAFGLVMLADGTRDLDGIALAASRAGLYRRRREIEEVLTALDGHDLLADGIEPGPMPSRSETQWVTPGPSALPLEKLPGYSFRCDASGACCSQYASVPLTAEDVRRARRTGWRSLPADEEGTRTVLPLYGSVRTERVAMTLVDGRCLQLDASNRCAIHAAGGLGSKPVGCRLYPSTLTDVGPSVRVSIATECDCVFSSLDLGEGDGDPLLAHAVRTTDDLPAGLTVRLLPLRIRMTEEREVPREEAIRWVDDALERGLGDDAVATCLHLAELLDGRGSELGGAAARIAESMAAAAEAAESWRSARDRTRRLRRAVASVASATVARGMGDALVSPSDELAQGESFALRAALFGMSILDARPLTQSLRDFAVRLILARELAIVGPRDLGHPIAAVMAAMRGA